MVGVAPVVFTGDGVAVTVSVDDNPVLVGGGVIVSVAALFRLHNMNFKSAEAKGATDVLNNKITFAFINDLMAIRGVPSTD